MSERPVSRPFRRFSLVLLTSAFFLMGAAAPTRRGHVGCSPGCAPIVEDPRSFEVNGTNWSDGTDLYLGSRSFDVDFQQDSPNEKKYKTTVAIQNDTNSNSPVKIKWAGDAISSLVMLSDSTTAARSWDMGSRSFSSSGFIPSRKTKSLAGDWAYTEIDWRMLTVGPDAVSTPDADSIEFRFSLLPQYKQTSSTTPGTFAGTRPWPWRDIDKTNRELTVHPTYRVYDHGLCGAMLPWSKNNGQIQGVSTVIKSHSNEFVKLGCKNIGIPPLGGGNYCVAEATLDLLPRLHRGGTPTDFDASLAGTLSDVRLTDDSIILSGGITGNVDVQIGIIGIGNTKFDIKIQTEWTFEADPEASYPNRLRLVERNRSVVPTFEHSWLPVYDLSFIDVEDRVMTEINTSLIGAKAQVQAQVNNVLTPFLPSQNELLRWFLQPCDGGNEPNSDPEVITGAPNKCVRRESGIGDDNLPNLWGGNQEFYAWKKAWLAGTTPAKNTLTTDRKVAPYHDSEPGPPDWFVALPDQKYQGCLTQDLHRDESVCDAKRVQLQGTLSLLIARASEIGASEPQKQALENMRDSLENSDFECRAYKPSSLSPFTAPDTGSSQDPLAQWTCTDELGNADDPKDRLCTKTTVWKDKERKAFGSPPDAVQCAIRSNIGRRPLPRKSSDECTALQNACYPVFGTQQGTTNINCADYWLYCGTADQYCDTDQTSPMQMLCANTIDEPRCLERKEYCEFTESCSDFAIDKYCEKQGFDQFGNTTCDNIDDPTTNDPGPFDGSAQTFRSATKVACGVCIDQRAKCSCATTGPAVGDYWCSFRIPVERVNVHPAGAEIVMVEGREFSHPDDQPNPIPRWGQILDGLTTLTSLGGQANTLPNLCSTPEIKGNSNKARSFAGSGVVPVIPVLP